MITAIDIQKLAELIKAFYNLTGIKVAVYDNNFCEVVAYPDRHSSFCAMVHDAPLSAGLCDKSAEMMCRKCAEEGKIIIEKCHAGLTESVAPLADGISTMGYIMFGQITNIKDKNNLVKTVSENCAKYGFDDVQLKKLLSEIPYYSDAQLDDASKILYALARYIVFDKIAYPAESTLVYNIADYIRDNLSEKLSVKDLCEHFYISKAEIYKLTKAYMPRGIAVFVKNERLKKSEELLLQTSMTSSQIAEAVGFADVNYFLRLFKNTKGMSAGEFRKKHKKY